MLNVIPFTLVKFSGAMEEKQSHTITHPPPYITVGVFFYYFFLQDSPSINEKKMAPVRFILGQLFELSLVILLTIAS